MMDIQRLNYKYVDLMEALKGLLTKLMAVDCVV